MVLKGQQAGNVSTTRRLHKCFNCQETLELFKHFTKVYRHRTGPTTPRLLSGFQLINKDDNMKKNGRNKINVRRQQRVRGGEGSAEVSAVTRQCGM